MPLPALREFQAARNAELRFATRDAERAFTDLGNMEGPRNARPSISSVPQGKKLRWSGGLRRVAIDDIDVVSRTSL